MFFDRYIKMIFFFALNLKQKLKKKIQRINGVYQIGTQKKLMGFSTEILAKMKKSFICTQKEKYFRNDEATIIASYKNRKVFQKQFITDKDYKKMKRL